MPAEQEKRVTETAASRSESSQIVQTHPDWWTDLDSKAVDTARLLAADAVQKVGNGHPESGATGLPAFSKDLAA